MTTHDLQRQNPEREHDGPLADDLVQLYQQAVGLEDARNEPACNPILQAELVNEAQVDLNIFMGLCIGHDTLLFKYVQAPVTVLAVKDRILGHNPLAAIYQYDSYYAYLKKPLLPEKK